MAKWYFGLVAIRCAGTALGEAGREAEGVAGVSCSALAPEAPRFAVGSDDPVEDSGDRLLLDIFDFSLVQF